MPTDLHQAPRLRTTAAVQLLKLYGFRVGRNKSYIFLGTFAKLLKANISCVMTVHMEQAGSHWTDVHET